MSDIRGPTSNLEASGSSIHAPINNFYAEGTPSLHSLSLEPVASHVIPTELIQGEWDLPTIPDSNSLYEPPSPVFPIHPPSRFTENPMVGRSSSRPHASKGFFGSFLRRKKKTKSLEHLHDALPPPIPPKTPRLPQKEKDKGLTYHQPIHPTRSPPQTSRMSHEGLLQHKRSRSLSDFAVISYTGDDIEDRVIRDPESAYVPSRRVPLKGKWAPLPAIPKDPAERTRRRNELQLRKEQEEKEAREAERRRQERIKTEKEQLWRQEEEERKRRKQEIEKEISRGREEKKKRETIEKDEEERKRQAIEERKKIMRDRRVEEHRKLEQWREDQAKKAEAAIRKTENAKQREEMIKQKRIREAAAKLKASKEEAGLSGWLTILNEESVAWKRRYYRFVGSKIFLYYDKNDSTTPLENLDLKGNLKALKEWNEGYEDLEAIQFSFVVEFVHDKNYWSIYADSEEEKFKLLGLFKVAAGL